MQKYISTNTIKGDYNWKIKNNCFVTIIWANLLDYSNKHICDTDSKK